jgi:hydroxypyruvate isomerase
MPRYAANLTMMWNDVPSPEERFRLAATAGFSAVERVFVYDLDVPATARLLDDLGLQLVLFDPYPGVWADGDRGLLSVAGREDELMESVRAAIEHAHVLGVHQTNVLAGVVPPDGDRQVAYDTARRNLQVILDEIDLGGVVILLESVCDDIWPGSFLDTVDLAAQMLREFDDPRLRLQFDAYHVARAGLEPLAALDRHIDLTNHVQIADHPGRHQPGTGGLPLEEFLARLDGFGYTGHVGLEYLPKGTTEESLSWLPVGARK